MEEKSFKKYIILWFSQSVSGLGSSMTGFALVWQITFLSLLCRLGTGWQECWKS